MSQFKAGDVVALNSGGPSMTVTEANEDRVWCVWIADGKAQTNSFPPACLTARGEPSTDEAVQAAWASLAPGVSP